MRIDDIKNIIQSAQLNFLFGAGLSCPYISVLNNIEVLLTELNTRGDLEDTEKTIIHCSIIYEYLRSVICRNLQAEIDSDKDGLYKQTVNHYNQFFKDIGVLLSKRHMNLCNKIANIFTTNIDMLVEQAIRSTSLEFNDGFNGRNPAVFDEGSFSKQSSKVSVYLQKSHELPTVNYVKLHGSINWIFKGSIVADDQLSNVTEIKSAFDKLPYLLDINLEQERFIDDCNKNDKPKPNVSEMLSHLIEMLKKDMQTKVDDIDISVYKTALECYSRIIMVNPTKSKFKETVMDLPFYEMMRLYSNALERPNSVLFVAGFSFADEHLMRITVRAANNNPTLQIIIFAYTGQEKESIEHRLNIKCDCHNGNILVIDAEIYKTINSEGNDTKVKINELNTLSRFDLDSINRYVFNPIVQSISHF